jgi:hypothetical protein
LETPTAAQNSMVTETPKRIERYDPTTANEIGHLTLLLSAIVCAIGLRGIPVFIWIIAYLFSAFFAAPTAWKEKPNLTPVVWFLGTILFGGLTALMYLIGVGIFGSTGKPWMIFRIPGILIPMLALTSVSSFARALYVRYRRGKESVVSG